MTTDRIALMIIRAWVEEGSSHPLRAQIRIASDVSDGVDTTLALATSEDVCTAVTTWLGDRLAGVTPV